jgi:hypothetical protein
MKDTRMQHTAGLHFLILPQQKEQGNDRIRVASVQQQDSVQSQA